MKKHFPFAWLLLCAIVGVAQQPVAQLPQTYIDTTFNLPTGVTWAAHTSTAFQSAINSANPGDTIVLDAGVIYNGNFTLPAKSNPNNLWIYIVSSALASLPAPGTRVSPTDAVNMPKIVSTIVTAPLTMAAGANHYRLVGLEVYGASTYGCNPNHVPPINCFGYELIGSKTAVGKALVDSITIDRCYIHGLPTIDQQRGININGSNYAVVDSNISEIHMWGTETQAIAGWWTPGPIKIVNNYLSSASQEILLGGAGGLNNPWVPSDIEIRSNWMHKPLAWDAVGVSLPPNNTMVVKNSMEFKSARRALVDSNVFENVWVAGQSGYSIVLTPRTNSSGLLAVVDDITITNNVLKNVSSGFDMTEYDSYCLPANGCTNPGEQKRTVIYNNLVLLGDTTQPGYANGAVFGALLTPQLTDIVFQHNTVIPPPNLGYCKSSWYFDMSGTGSPTPPLSRTHNVWVLDNVLCRQIYGPYGWVGQFSNVLPDYMGDPSPVNPRLFGNVFYAPRPDSIYSIPPNNYTSSVPFTYVSPSTGNYQLSSPYWTATSDGNLAGVNNSALP